MTYGHMARVHIMRVHGTRVWGYGGMGWGMRVHMNGQGIYGNGKDTLRLLFGSRKHVILKFSKSKSDINEADAL